MKNNKFAGSFLVVISLLLLFIVDPPQPVQAARTDNKVLLVYDSQNNLQKKAKNIDALQRVLTSMNLQVRTVEQADYKKGDLNSSYVGVITMINWRQVGLKNQAFITDRSKFSGIKLHIGNNLLKSEIEALGGSAQNLYRQQFILKNHANTQTLPFSETITVMQNLPESAKTFGTLSTQQADQKSYPFGVINGTNGYLPSFRSSGLSLMTEIELIGQLFNRVGKYQPLLTFTNVTPYSNLEYIDDLSLYCYKNEIPFAISTTSVSQNTDLKAFDRFTAVMRSVENRGGIIFLNAPEVSNADNSGQTLSNKFSDYLVTLAQHKVFPVGVSAPGYWNQDKILRNNFLDYGDHWLMLPDPEETAFVHQDNKADVATESFFTMPLSSLKEVKKTSTMAFAIPTALTISMPDSKTHMQMVKRELSRSQLTWYDPANNLTTRIATPSTLLEYKYGNYFANSQQEDTQISSSLLNKEFDDGSPKAAMSKYFRVQGNVFMVFFVIVTVVLLVFIYLGQRVYWNNFRRK